MFIETDNCSSKSKDNELIEEFVNDLWYRYPDEINKTINLYSENHQYNVDDEYV